ncbi:GIY-YIG nuclease family protein [Planctomicrobium piriforme]|uniref:GIY-YIG nuclease family protein n=1 Tax=Planctomicrobium piriforme TaxID=1576369 RepID=UPI001C315BB6|nr:GIY-YIG nuclease family protein [Planctomicrobium piriforme]
MPEPPQSDLWSNPRTALLLLSTGILALTALLGFWSSAVVAVACALASLGFGIFGFIRHAEAQSAEHRLKHHAETAALAVTLQTRCSELTLRYQNLLSTGNQRIAHYFKKIDAESSAYRRAADSEIFRCRQTAKAEIAEAERQKASATELAIREQQRASLVDKRASETVANVEQRMFAVAARIIADNLKNASSKLRADPESYQRQKTALAKTFDFVERVGYPLPDRLRSESLEGLKESYRLKVREQALKDEQKRIRQQAIEEARNLKLQEQREQEAREAEEREAELAERLAQVLSEQEGVHSQEVEELKRQLADAQAKSERAKSLAQITKVGHVYILSNLGSFGPDVFKVGMTRREDPQDRVRELGDASVPFPFDVHAMISCTDAPSLENALHRELTRYRVNRVNLRKEYFRIDLQLLLDAVVKHHGQVDYVAEPEALQYRDSQNIDPEDLVELTEELAEMGVNLNEDDELDEPAEGQRLTE